MRGGVHYKKLYSFVAVTVAAQLYFTVSANSAMAACTTATGAGMDIGNVICNVVANTQDAQGFFPGMCYLFGLIIGLWAIGKLYEHVQNPAQVSMWEPIKRAICAGCLFGLPIVMEAAYNTMTGGPGEEGLGVSSWAGETSGGGLDAMAVALMEDGFGPMASLLMLFSYLAGLVLIVIGILRLLKSAQEGPRGPGGFGTIMTFIVAGALFSADQMMAAWSTTLMGTNDVANTADLNFNAGLGDAEEAHILSVISAILAFVMVLGWISFIRGWFIIRDVAEGNQQASLMAALTHLFGGALAINLGPFLNAVQETFGLGAIGVNFTIG